jgi:hypothetical protein
VRVPEEAAAGKATVTVSFSDWKEAQVAPATFEITLADISPEEEAKAERELRQAEEERLVLLRSILFAETDFLQAQLKKETDPKKRQEIQERLENVDKRLQKLKK